MSFDISMKTFRAAINKIRDPRDSALLKLAYLGAFRNSELCSNVSPSELLNNRSKPYGNFLKVQLKKYPHVVNRGTKKEETVIEQVLLLTAAVAKRGKRIKRKGVKEDDREVLESYTDKEIVDAFQKFGQMDLLDRIMREEVEVDPKLVKILLGKLSFKYIALPMNDLYEPWVYDVVRYMVKVRKKRDLSFAITRKHFWCICRKHLSCILPAKAKDNLKNPLRHYRLTHLVEYYNFEPYDLTLISGWTFQTAFGSLGIRASPNVGAYIHLRWQSYFPKLLRPLKEVC